MALTAKTRCVTTSYQPIAIQLMRKLVLGGMTTVKPASDAVSATPLMAPNSAEP